MIESPFVDLSFDVPVFSPGNDPIACLNKAMAFLTAVASSRFPSTNNQLRTSSNPRNQATIQDGRVTVQQVQGRQGKNYSGTTYKGNATSSRGNTTSGQARVVKCYNCQEAQEAGQILVEEKLAFLAEPRIPAGSDVISEVPNFETYLNDMDNQSVLALQDFENVQDTNLQAQQDSMILSVIEQMSEQMINHVNNWENANKEQNSESITTELERYKKRVKTFKQCLNIDLSSHEKMIDSQMDDMIREKLALKEQINSLEQNLSKQIKEKESIKDLDNIICKVGQSAQKVHMLTKPQAFYDNTHKQALETLILEEEIRSKMLEKAKDPEVVAKKISHKPIDYGNLNSLIDYFGKCFSPQQEFLAEQAFWFPILNPIIEPSYTPPVIVDVPSELPKVSLMNASLKKLKFHLTQFDSVVKKRTTPSALEGDEWGFEHTKAVFNKEIILFLKSFKDIFNVFDKNLLNEITEVQTVFDQMEASVQ
ncbi:hypothetical protein Tco_0935072 [Tanacetum coccineum]